MKKNNFLILAIIAMLFIWGCRSESLNSIDEVSTLSVSGKTDTTGTYKMKDVPDFKNYLQKKLISSISKSNEGSDLFPDDKLVDVINIHGKVSYSTVVNKGNSVFDILVYTVSEKEKSFFIAEFVSDKEMPYLDFHLFNGTVNYKTGSGEIFSSIRFENGKPLSQTANKVVGCITTITTPVSCIEGLHMPGQPCAYAGTLNAAYYDTQIINNCHTNQIYNDIGGGGGYGSGGGGSNPAYNLPAPNALNYMLLQIGMSTLNSQQFSYVQNNVAAAEKLRTYFLDNQNINGANFLYWGIDFLRQNPSVSWEQFESWFMGESLNSNLQNELFEDWSDPTRVKPSTKFKNHTKLNSIYNKIKSAANFKQYLQNFESTFSVAHLIFDIGTCQNSNALAETSPPTNYWIIMTFNKDKDWTNIPKIVIADTFMHEMIHAEIFRKLLSLSSSNGNIDTALITQYLNSHNYPGLFDYYIKRTVGNENWQHEAMAAHYVNIMVNFLKQAYGSQYTDIEYKTIVWMGLQGTTAWNLLQQSEKDVYINTWNTNYWLWEL